MAEAEAAREAELLVDKAPVTIEKVEEGWWLMSLS